MTGGCVDCVNAYIHGAGTVCMWDDKKKCNSSAGSRQCVTPPLPPPPTLPPPPFPRPTTTTVMMSVELVVAREQATWSTAKLSIRRWALASVSIGDFVMFAGGLTGGKMSVFEVEHLAWRNITVRLALNSLVVSRGPQEAAFPMQSICTTVPPGHGRLRSSAWRAVILHPRVLETWHSLLGVEYLVKYCQVRDCFMCNDK